MKKNLIPIILSIVLFMGCKAIDKLTQFEMNYDETVTIPSSVGVNLPFDVFTPDITTNSESAFSVNDTRKDLIEKIQLTGLDLTVTSPTNGDFSFLKSISIYISASGLPEIEIASKDAIDPNVGNTLALETTNADLKEYIKADSFSLRVNTVTDELITTDYEIAIHSTFFVDAKILGI